ncbi:MAG: preprotein translocase subunit SecA [Azospirillum brasilense]|nr:MAG: preprotein translocase subunit SecA [Azospirillum brasilense]
MLSNIAKKIFGSSNERIVTSLRRTVEEINALEATISALSDDELRAKTDAFKAALANGTPLDKLTVEAFAVVREAGKRVLGMRHFDEQLIGGLVLHKSMISEMKTGEGKTLVATLPAYLNALTGKGVHIVTVNDYLAQRDSAWMGKIHEFLGLSVGVIVHGLDDDQRRAAYACDITYGTNNEYGFDYLRDNMKYSREDMVQRPFNYAIVDEVDSILIDEARTPLIISGPTEDNSELYMKVDRLIPTLLAAHVPSTLTAQQKAAANKPDEPNNFYEHDEKQRSASLTEAGVAFMEQLLAEHGLLPEGAGLYDIENVSVVHHVQQALRAHVLFKRDTDYIVKNNKVVIIDEFTGRMMEGRRYSEGLHQALEAKEKVTIQNENQTLASITFQNYFRLFPKLAGMTGTAMTEAGEFHDIYKLEVIEIPTHRAVARQDMDDEIYRTSAERDRAVIKLITEAHARNQPVLVGTVSIEKSESFAAVLKKEKIPHQVLNARFHEQEAQIIAQAGRPGAITIATNMAGRGTDIMLGGNADMLIKQEAENKGVEALDAVAQERIRSQVEADKEVVRNAGGLFVIGTERHESRRIDNQLRGRSGRQGDPGASKFFLSLQDDLMRIFGSERIDAALTRLGLKEDEAIFHPWMNKAIERAQTKVEQRNYEIRKTLLKFDDVMNDQRKVIYEQRLELMDFTDVHETVEDMRADVNAQLVAAHIPAGSYADAWDVAGLASEVKRIYGLELPVADWAAEEGIADEEILARLENATREHMLVRAANFPPDIFAIAEKRVLMETLDQLWKDHLLSLDHLRQGINLRAYAQRDPLNEYKQEAFSLFEHMLNHLREVVVSRLSRVQIRVELSDELMRMKPQQEMHESRVDPALAAQMDEAAPQASAQTLRMHVKPQDRVATDPASWGKVARNEPCPCGSGKKFKHCHGTLA